MSDQRRHPRKRPSATLRVTDAMTGRLVGRVGDLSPEGMLLLSDVEFADDALYQFGIELPDALDRTRAIEVGVHEAWTEPAQAPGHWWSGFRFIDLGEAEERTLRDWLARQGDG